MSEEKCKESAIKYLSYKDRTEKELVSKLREKGYSDEEIASAAAFAREYGYIDDERYARNYINDAAKLKGYGLNRAKTELLRRGIDRYIVEKEIENVENGSEFSEKERILETMRRRFENADLGNPKERNRIFGYFARRGYAPNDIWGAINSRSAFDDINAEDEL